jgi:hypothetical protein
MQTHSVNSKGDKGNFTTGQTKERVLRRIKAERIGSI